MATSKKKSKPAKKSKTGTAPAALRAKKKGGVKKATKSHRVSATNATVDLASVTQLLASLDPLTAVQEGSFTRQFSDARCDEQGAKTAAVNVLREACRAVAGMDAVVRANGTLMGYMPVRLRFLAECIQTLSMKVAMQAAMRTTGSITGAALLIARSAAHTARTGLDTALKHVAEGNSDATARYDAALGRPHSDSETVDSINNLVALARSWIAGSDALLASLCASHAVTEAGCVAAASAAAALSTAVNANKVGSAPARDLPDTNRIEGRVTLEMGVFYRANELGRTRNKSIAALVLGPTLRRVLIAKSHKKTGAATIVAPAPASPPAAPPASGTGTPVR